jgi:hypothetical protein
MQVKVVKQAWDNVKLLQPGDIIDFDGDRLPSWAEPLEKDEPLKDGSPYADFKQADFNAELAKRGINFSNIRSNKDKEDLLLKNDEETKMAEQSKFDSLKAEAESLEIQVEESDTTETLEEKIKAKKGE